MWTKWLIPPLFLLASLLPVRAEKPFLPAEPRQILTALPPASKDWDLTRSQARHLYRGRLVSVADRVYRESSTDDREPRTLSIQLIDTAKDPALNLLFDNSPQRSPSLPPLQEIKGHPMLEDQNTERGSRIRVQYAKRYIATITGTGLSRSELEKWAAAIDNTALLQLKEVSPAPDKGVLELAFVDELNPNNNRTSLLSLVDEEEVERIKNSTTPPAP
jgi:hypothetical protein